ncbi:MAG: hypothetical protein GY841_06935, partial [FCB group bacterium]|nr:hypothetical protein [FCB group bacterium]
FQLVVSDGTNNSEPDEVIVTVKKEQTGEGPFLEFVKHIPEEVYKIYGFDANDQYLVYHTGTDPLPRGS